MRMFNKAFKDDSLLSEVSRKIDSTKFCLGYRGRARRMADSTQLLNVEKPADATAESSLLLAWVRLQIATRDAKQVLRKCRSRMLCNVTRRTSAGSAKCGSKHAEKFLRKFVRSEMLSRKFHRNSTANSTVTDSPARQAPLVRRAFGVAPELAWGIGDVN